MYWIFFIAVFLLTGFIGYGTFATARLLQQWQPKENLLLMPAETVFRFFLILLCVGLGILSGVPYEQLGWQVDQLGRQLLEGLVWGVIMALGFYWSTKILLRRGGERFYSSVIINAITPRNRRELGLVLLAMILVVLLEELLFRSLLLGGLAPLLPMPLLLISWSVAFGLLHSPQGTWGMVGAGLAGLILGMLFVTRNSLLLPVVAHYVANVAQIIQAMRLGYGRQTSQEAEPSLAEEA